MAPNKIDVHQHVLPPFWVDYLRPQASRYRLPEWSPEAAIASMDAQGIAKGFLSLTDPGVLPWPEAEQAGVARRVNEYTTDLAARWPDRFGNFVALPLPDVDAALAELTHAFDILGADGVVLFSNYGDRYLGDPAFGPVWEELNRRDAVVLIHPNRTALPDIPGVPPALVDFPFATTRTAVHLVLAGVLDRNPEVRVILSHAGGFLPYAAHRFAMGGGSLPGSAGADGLLQVFRQFYLDTALSTGPTVIPSLKAFADPTHIVFGSDFPYAAGLSTEFTALLDASPLLTEPEHAAVSHLNAISLLRGRGPRAVGD